MVFGRGERGGEPRLPLPESVDEIHRLGRTLNEMLARRPGQLASAMLARVEHEPNPVKKAKVDEYCDHNDNQADSRN